MQLNLHRLWIFLQVLECGGFSAAAQKLYMSQPSVSAQVRQLERSLKATLVDRSGSRVRPTAEGEVLADHARRIFLLADEAIAAIAQVQGLTVGRLAVAGTSTVGTYLLPALLARFAAEHPALEHQLQVGNSEQVVRWLLDGDVGLAILADRPTAAQLVVEPMFTDQMVLVAPAAHRLAGRPVRPEDLAAEQFLLREPGSGTRALQEATLARWGLHDAATADHWGSETLKRSVAAGLGITLISEHALPGSVGLAAIEVDPEPLARQVVLAYRRDRLLSAAERAFRATLQTLEGWPADPVG